VEYTQEGEAILLCEITPTEGCLTPLTVATRNSGPSIGFPRMALGQEGVFLAWTAPEDTISQLPQGGTTIKVAFLGMQ
jgi:hypothetical protein